jgi:hypothetical protein
MTEKAGLSFGARDYFFKRCNRAATCLGVKNILLLLLLPVSEVQIQYLHLKAV